MITLYFVGANSLAGRIWGERERERENFAQVGVATPAVKNLVIRIFVERIVSRCRSCRVCFTETVERDCTVQYSNCETIEAPTVVSNLHMLQ